MRAWLNLRYLTDDRAQAFRSGLQALGYAVMPGVTMDPAPADILCTWNRIGSGHRAALAFEAAGRPVLVAENATWGNDFAGRRWYTLARNWHNRAGCFPVGGPERWDALGVDLQPWRTGGETVVLPQRGIGVGSMPNGWTNGKKGRIRQHPGQRPCTPLEQDLARAGRVITWGSGAAIKAAMLGIQVESHMPGWIGEHEATDESRLAMFRRLAWAQFTMAEIAAGMPFRRLLCAS